MKLAKEIVFHQLKKYFSVDYYKKKGILTKFDRPVLFDRTATLDGRVVVLDANDFEEYTAYRRDGGCLVVSIGKPPACDGGFEDSVIFTDGRATLVEVFNRLQDIFSLFDDWDRTLQLLYYEAGSFADLIACSKSVVSDPISILDKDFHFVAYSQESIDLGYVSLYNSAYDNIQMDYVNAILADPAYVESLANQNSYMFSYPVGDGICKNIFYKDEYVGRVDIPTSFDDTDACEYHSQILEILGNCIERTYKKYHSFSQSEITLSSVKGLIDDGMSGKVVSEDAWSSSLSEIGWSTYGKLRTIQLRPDPRYDNSTYSSYFGEEIEQRWQGCICFEFNGYLMMLISVADFKAADGCEFNQALAYFLRDSLLVAGISRDFSEARYLRSSYQECAIALEYGAANAPTLWYHEFDEYALSYMISSSVGSLSPERICSEKLMMLIKHDDEKDTEYVKTLQAYFECRLNASAAAKKLYLQRSSFLYRMSRIDDLVHIDFDSNDEILYLVLSLKCLVSDE